MRKLEGVVKEIVDELNYLKRREMRMRDTNGESRLASFVSVRRERVSGADVGAWPMLAESTNARVKNFFYLTFSTLILLGVWQVVHLRSYFKKSACLSLECLSALVLCRMLGVPA